MDGHRLHSSQHYILCYGHEGGREGGKGV